MKQISEKYTGKKKTFVMVFIDLVDFYEIFILLNLKTQTETLTKIIQLNIISWNYYQPLKKKNKYDSSQEPSTNIQITKIL